MKLLKSIQKHSLALSGTAFLLLSFLVHAGALREIDKKLLLIFQAITPRALDPFLSLFSLFGSFWIITLSLSLLLLALKKYRLLLSFLFLTFVLHLVEIFGKNFIGQPLPPKELVRTTLLFYPPYSSLKTSFAFPSGHSLRAVLTSLIANTLIQNSKLSPFAKKAFKLVIFLLLFLMLYSRISLGEHWPSDVIAGGILGYVGWKVVRR